MATPALEYWYELCFRAFNNDKKANDFVLFLEGCKTKPPTNGLYCWETTELEFQQHLKALGCEPLDNVWTLPIEKLSVLSKHKSQARSQWHIQRQEQLKAHLSKTLSSITTPLDITDQQRIALVKEFVQVHQTDVGSVPFLRGLVGCLKYQLQNKYQVIEWKLSEYVLTQNDEEAMESYVRLLRGVLGFQLLYQDDTDDDSDKVIININQQPLESVLIWQMNPNLENGFIQSVLKCLPKEHNLNDYQVSNTKRNITEPQTIFQWFYTVFSQCLSFLH